MSIVRNKSKPQLIVAYNHRNKRLAQSFWPQQRVVLNAVRREMKDNFMIAIDPIQQFIKNSRSLIRVCHKPDLPEIKKNLSHTVIGVFVIGSFGFVLKLVMTPVVSKLIGG
ncbi:MAG: Protein transport protein Sec61 subunit gamma [Marteilia pararefringens]